MHRPHALQGNSLAFGQQTFEAGIKYCLKPPKTMKTTTKCPKCEVNIVFTKHLSHYFFMSIHFYFLLYKTTSFMMYKFAQNQFSALCNYSHVKTDHHKIEERHIMFHEFTTVDIHDFAWCVPCYLRQVIWFKMVRHLCRAT